MDEHGDGLAFDPLYLALAASFVAIAAAAAGICCTTCGLLTGVFGGARKSSQCRVATGVLLISLSVYMLMSGSLARSSDLAMNYVQVPAPGYPAVTAAVQQLHQSLSLVADMHADPLIWPRDLSQPHPHGHVDFARLRRGNVALQVFGTVTKFPFPFGFDRNSNSSDLVFTLLSFGSMWPVAAWTSPFQRALVQAGKLHQFAAQDADFILVRDADTLATLRQARQGGARSVIGGILSVEGAHCIEGRISNAQALWEAGVRMMSFAHFFDTELVGSAHGIEQYGLTALGRQLLAWMQQRSMIVDVAHVSQAGVDDILALSTRAIVASHTGVKAVCPHVRNLDDDQLRGIADTGGLISIAFFRPAVCGEDIIGSIGASVRHVADLVGVQHVALGSDWDGAVRTPFDAAGLVYLTHELSTKQGFTDDEIDKIMGRNVFDFLAKNLPRAS